MGRLFEGRGWFYMGRLYVMSLRRPLRTRRGGGRVVEGGDACVALAGEGRHSRDEGDAQHKASPPRIISTPAPTGTKQPSERH